MIQVLTTLSKVDEPLKKSIFSKEKKICLLYLTSIYPVLTHMQHICLIIMACFSLVFSSVVRTGPS